MRYGTPTKRNYVTRGWTPSAVLEIGVSSLKKHHREPCAFCPATADITGEHIWSAWAGEILGPSTYTFTRQEEDGSVKTWQKAVLDSKTKVVCSSCNNGWMSGIEASTKAIAKDMVASGASTKLDSEAIGVLAAFGFLKAVIADHSHDHAPPFYPFAERQQFGTSLTIPDGVQVWIAALTYQHGLFKSGTLRSKLDQADRSEINVFTFGMGRLVLQVTCSRWMKKAYRRHAFSPSLSQHPIWDRCAMPIYPIKAELVGFPPPRSLAEQDIPTFVERWNTIQKGIGPVYRDGRKVRPHFA